MGESNKRNSSGFLEDHLGVRAPAGKVQQEFVRAPKPSYNQGVEMRSIFPATIKAVGPVTGKPYVWSSSGDVVLVDPADVDGLLAKRIGSTSCCGPNRDGNRAFELVQ